MRALPLLLFLALPFVAHAQGGGCEPPQAVIDGLPQRPACIGVGTTFDAGLSAAAPGHTISTLEWDLGDGATAAGIGAAHTYLTPGAWDVRLVVTDDVGCSDTAFVQVLVAPLPDASHTFAADTMLCLGESTQITGSGVPGTWGTSAAIAVLPNGSLALPDGAQGEAVLDVAFADPLVVETGTIQRVCITMEHSYIGDLIVDLTAPNGASVVLFDGNTAGPQGTYLGSPDDETTGIPGTGWTYCFADPAPWGTLAEENVAENHTVGGTPPEVSMTPGLYSPEEPFTGWNGSAVNGIWSLHFEDDQGSDDGYLFGWWMDILTGDSNDTTFYTTVGVSCDSLTWAGPGGVVTLDSCLYAIVTPTGPPGISEYTFSVTDNAGCIGTTSIAIHVAPAPNIDISGPSLVATGADEEYVATDVPGATYTWTLTGGTIQDGQGTPTILVHWNDPENATLDLTVGTLACHATASVPIALDPNASVHELQGSILGIRPNPTSGFVTFSFPSTGKATVTIMDATGRTILISAASAASGTFTYDTTGLPAGNYRVCIATASERWTAPLVVIN